MDGHGRWTLMVGLLFLEHYLKADSGLNRIPADLPAAKIEVGGWDHVYESSDRLFGHCLSVRYDIIIWS